MTQRRHHSERNTHSSDAGGIVVKASVKEKAAGRAVTGNPGGPKTFPFDRDIKKQE
jgi:hypothetical protein